ncbi:MAG: aldolase [Rhodospirillaceae bacterium]|nr:aldolase [Rhodospirillaceae bacterium]MDG1273987.1 RraA family protein [Alphaproteobacteria bacterium]MDG1887523.1 RraA family protein [Alphaproteobacteria bacterium]
MLEDPPILTVKRVKRRPTTVQIEAFRGAMTGNVADCMGGRGAMSSFIKPLNDEGATICGPALPCFAYPADNLGVMGALHLASVGDIIVCATDAYNSTAVVGDLVCGMMKNKGVVAFVTDGMVRDQVGIAPWEFPVFCQGVNPNSPARTGPGSVGLRINLAGVSVEAGDMVICDRDGVVIVPFHQIDEVLTKLSALKTAETEMETKIKNGATEPGYLSELMRSAKTVYLD